MRAAKIEDLLFADDMILIVDSEEKNEDIPERTRKN